MFINAWNEWLRDAIWSHAKNGAGSTLEQPHAPYPAREIPIMKDAHVAAVVITYHPPAVILQNIAAVAAQVGHVVVVDNTPNQCRSGSTNWNIAGGCTVIRNGKNRGIATALNLGVQRAISLGCEWIFTFDQDSRIGDGYIDGSDFCLWRVERPNENRRRVSHLS